MISLACVGCSGGERMEPPTEVGTADQGIEVASSMPRIAEGGPGDMAAISDHVSNGFELIGAFRQGYPTVTLEMARMKGIYIGQSQPMVDINFSFRTPDGWEFPTGTATRPFFRLTAQDGATVDIGAHRRRNGEIGSQLLVGLTKPFEQSKMSLMSGGKELANWDFENVPITPENLPLVLSDQPIEAGLFTVTADPVTKMKTLASGREIWSFSPNLKIGGIEPKSDTHIAMAWALLGTDQAPGWYVESAGSIPVSKSGEVESTIGIVHGGLPKIAILRGIVEESIYAEVTASIAGLAWRLEEGELYVAADAPQEITLEARHLEIDDFDEIVQPDTFIPEIWRLRIPVLVIDPRLVDSAEEWSRVSFDTGHLPGKWRAWMDSMSHGIMNIEVDAAGYQHLLTKPESIEFVVRIHRATQSYPFRIVSPITRVAPE